MKTISENYVGRVIRILFPDGEHSGTLIRLEGRQAYVDFGEDNFRNGWYAVDSPNFRARNVR